MANSKPIIRKGATAALASTNTGNFVGVGEGEQLEFAPLVGIDEVISFDQHAFWAENPENTVIFPCLQTPDCPGELLGNKPRLRVLILVAYKNDDGELVAGILPIGLSVLRTLVDLDSAIDGGIKNSTMILKRSGSGLKTRYTLVATGGKLKKKVEHDIDVEEAVGETDRDAIIEMLQENGWDISPIEAYDHKASAAAARGEAPESKKKGKKEAATQPVADDVEDDVEDEGEEDGDWA